MFLEVLNEATDTFFCLFFKLSTIKSNQSEVVKILDLELHFPVGRPKFFELVSIGHVRDLSLVYQLNQALILTIEVLIEIYQTSEVVIIGLDLNIHVVLEQKTAQIKNDVLKCSPNELDIGTQFDQLLVGFLNDVSNNELDLSSEGVGRIALLYQLLSC